VNNVALNGFGEDHLQTSGSDLGQSIVKLSAKAALLSKKPSIAQPIPSCS